MIYKLTLSIFILISIYHNSYNSQNDLLQDTIIRKDTGNKTIKSTSEVTIKFDNTKLSPLNVRIIFNDFFKKYTGIKESLVYNDSYGAGSKTLTLLDEMKSKSNEVLKDTKDARWEIFMQNYNSIRSKVQDIKFIDDQRFTFNEISRGLEGFIKQHGLHDKTIYLMYCKDDATGKNLNWLSDKKDNKNPYTGIMNDTGNVILKETWIFE